MLQIQKPSIKKPSVSELLDLLAKPALIGWANKQGLLGIKVAAKRRKLANDGSSLHRQIDDHCNGVVDAFKDENDRIAFERFLEGKEIVSTEQDIETEWFTGRYDAKFSIDGEKYIIDYKSGSSDKIYLEQKLQLVAYSMVEGVTKFAIVKIPRFGFIPVEIADTKPYEEMLITLSKLWRLKKEIELG